MLDYLLIGHITADIKREGRRLGGTVSYAAPIARAFGYRTGILTSAAVCEPLLEPLLDEVMIQVVASHATTTFENIYSQDGNRTQYVHDIARSLEYGHIPQGWLGAPLIHLAPLVNEVDLSIAQRIRRHHPQTRIMLTPQGLMRRWDRDGHVHYREWFDETVIRQIDIIVFSRQDIGPQPELEARFAGVANHLFVTDGARGGTYYHQGAAFPYPAMSVDEVDPTGAGDVFATSLLASLPKIGGDYQRAMNIAARLAALSVTRSNAQKAVMADEVTSALQQEP